MSIKRAADHHNVMAILENEMEKLVDIEMLQTIFSEVGISLEQDGSVRGDFQRPWDDHTAFSVQLQHDIDRILENFPRDDLGLEFFQMVNGGFFSDKNSDLYKSIIPAISTLIQWLIWIRENDNFDPTIE